MAFFNILIQKIESTLRPSSAQPQFIPPMSESLEDLRHTMPEGSESSDDTYNNSNQVIEYSYYNEPALFAA